VVSDRAHLPLQIAPHGFRPAIGPRDPGGGTGIDAAVERLVAFAHLLPFEASETTPGLHRDELLGNELLDPFGLGAARQVHVARRECNAGRKFLVGRYRKAQEAVGLALESGNRDGPQPSAPAQLPAALGDVDIARTNDGRCAVEALDALDRRDLGLTHPARPGVNGGRLITCVDRKFGNADPAAVHVRPAPSEQTSEFVPGLRPLGSPFDHDMVDEPALEAAAPGPDRDLDAVLLDVGAGGEEQPAVRDGPERPGLAPLIEALPVWRLAGLDPGLAQYAVLEAALGLVRGGRFRKARDIRPGEPADRRIERRDVESDRVRILRLGGGAPLASREHRRLVVLFDPAVTALALVMRRLGPALLPLEPLELKPLHLPAVRARHEVAPLVGSLVLALDAR